MGRGKKLFRSDCIPLYGGNPSDVMRLKETKMDDINRDVSSFLPKFLSLKKIKLGKKLGKKSIKKKHFFKRKKLNGLALSDATFRRKQF